MSGPETRHAAFCRITGHAGDLRTRVLAFIRSRGADGATDSEGEAALAMMPQTYTPRRGELVEAAAVIDSGNRRPTPSGRMAAVWVASQQAPNAAPQPREGGLFDG